MIEKKIKKAVDCKRLKLVEGNRNWYNYFLSIQELVWYRNNHDGYVIDVYNKQCSKHLTRLII